MACSSFLLVAPPLNIGSTATAILGVFEPVTAVIFGVLVFDEVLTAKDTAGLLLILVAVTLVVSGSNIHRPLMAVRQSETDNKIYVTEGTPLVFESLKAVPTNGKKTTLGLTTYFLEGVPVSRNPAFKPKFKDGATRRKEEQAIRYCSAISCSGPHGRCVGYCEMPGYGGFDGKDHEPGQ